VRVALCAGTTLGGSDALTKTTIALVAGRHLGALAPFAPYALVAVGAAGFLLQQRAYRAGELAAALPAALVAEPAAGSLLGLTVFQERFATHGPPGYAGSAWRWSPRWGGGRRLAAAPLVSAAALGSRRPATPRRHP